MKKKWCAMLLAILLIFIGTACIEEPVVEEPPEQEVAEALPVEEALEPEEDEAEEEETILGLMPDRRELSSDEAVYLALEAFDRVLEHIFPEPGAVDMDLVIGFEVEAMGMTVNYRIHGNWRAIVEFDDEESRMALSWDFGAMEDAVEMVVVEDESGEFFVRFAQGDEVIDLDFDTILTDDAAREIFESLESYMGMFISIDFLMDGDFLSAEIEDAEDGSAHYTVVLCDLGAYDIVLVNDYMFNVLEGFVESFTESSGIEIFPVFQESLLVIVMDADGRPMGVSIVIDIAFDADEDVDMAAQFTMEYTFNAFDGQVVIQRPE